MVPTGEPLTTKFTANTPPLLPEGWENAILFPMLVAFQALEEGPYTVNVEVDGQSKSIPIRVGLGVAPEG